MRDALIHFLDRIKDYEHESGHSMHKDERESSEIVDIHLEAVPELKNYVFISNVSGLFVLYREGAIDRIYWNSDEFQPYKAGCPTYSWEKANEYSKLLKCNFTDAE